MHQGPSSPWRLLTGLALFGAISSLFGCVQAGTARACPVPAIADDTRLGFRETHDFGKDYEVFELMVKLDSCIFYHSDDTAVLGRVEIDTAPLPVSAGPHAIEIITRFRSGPSADMHDYVWWSVQKVAVLLRPNVTQTLVVHRTQVMHRDPRRRMQANVDIE